MRLFARASFKVKLIVVMTLASFCTLVLALLALFAYESVRSRHDQETDLRSLAELIGVNSVGAIVFGDGRAATENLASLAVKPYVDAAALYDEAGRRLAAYQRPGLVGDIVPLHPEPEGGRREGGALLIFHAVRLEGRTEGAVFLRANTKPVQSRMAGYGLLILVVMLVSAGVAMGLSAWLQGVVSRPVLQLTAATLAVSAHDDYSIRVPSAGNDEVGQLGAAFNSMLSRIEEQSHALRAARDQLEARVQERVHELRLEVHARERAQKARDESEARYRAIVETTNEWIWAMDATGRSTFNNPAVERILGFSPDELEGASFLDLLDPRDRAGAAARLADLVSTKSGWHEQVVRWRHRNGALRSVESTGVPVLGPEGEVVGFQGVSRDITERLALEEGLRQSQKLEAIGRLAGGVAHDFNNLLGVILGHTERLRRSACGSEPRIDEIEKAAERAAGLTRQLLAFSRKQVLESRVVDLRSVVQDLGALLRRMIGEDIELIIECPSTLWAVRADPGQLGQVLMNLAVNARDAMPRGGVLKLSTANVALSDAEVIDLAPMPSGCYVLLTVADTGTGMDEQTQSHAFEPFFSTKEPGRGTGLGLSTVYGIVKQSGGFVWVESDLGRGTTFRIYLPSVAEQARDEAPREEPVTAGGNETILLVEDEEALRSITAETLSEQGYTVVEAADGNEALRMVEAHSGPLDLLLTDIVMPGMGGAELAQHVVARRPPIGVVFISGYAEGVVGGRGRLESGGPRLSKPFTSADLLRTVRRALDERRPQHKGERETS